MTNGLPKRSPAIDILKAISCVAVILIHTASTPMDTIEVLTFDWLSSAFWGCLIRFAVPVFLMCSGALMFDPARELTIRRIYKDYFLRILVALLVWALLYDWFMVLGSAALGGAFDPMELLRAVIRVLKFQHHFHLYYLQILLIFYACLPIMRVFVKNAEREVRIYVLAVWFILGVCLPFLKQFSPFNQISGIPAQYAIAATWAALGYGLLGWEMCAANFGRDRLPHFITMFLLGFVLVFGGTVAFSAREGSLDQRFLEGLSPGVALMASGLFGCVSALAQKASPFAAKLVKPTFCVYIIHHFFIMIFRTVGLIPEGWPMITAIPVLAAAVLAASLILWYPLSRIPWVKNWLI